MLTFLLLTIILLLCVIIWLMLDMNDQPHGMRGGEIGWPRSLAHAYPQWSVEGRLGEGGIGRVYQVWDPSIGQRMAVKVMRGAFRDHGEMRFRFMDEAVILARGAASGYAPRVLYYGSAQDPCPWFAMELLEGFQTLDAWIVASGWSKGTFRRRQRLAREIALAVAGLHYAGVVHRDLCPKNILVRDRRLPEVRVIDFGSARLVDGNIGGVKLLHRETQVGWFAGKRCYAAPECIVKGMRNAGPEADVFSLAIVLCEMMGGECFRYDQTGKVDLSPGITGELFRRLTNMGVMRSAALLLLRALDRPDRRPAAAQIAEVL